MVNVGFCGSVVFKTKGALRSLKSEDASPSCFIALSGHAIMVDAILPVTRVLCSTFHWVDMLLQLVEIPKVPFSRKFKTKGFGAFSVVVLH